MKIKKYQFGGPSDYFNWLTAQLSGSNIPILTGVSLHLNNVDPALLILGVPIIKNYPTSPEAPKPLNINELNNKTNNNLQQQLLKLTSTGNQVLSGGAQLAGLIGTLFSQGSSTAMGRLSSNIMKGLYLTEGLGQDVGASLAGAAAGLAGNYIGRGITSLGGNSMLSRGIGAGTGTAIGSVGGTVLSNAVKGKTLLSGLTSGANITGLAGSVVGAGLQAAFGPSKEYGGKHGNITKTMDTIYDIAQTAIGFVPGWGTLASGAMALNKGLSNIFGSTSGMTKTDAILGSAWMGAPVKWLNMAGASKTGAFNNLSWLNQEKATRFMGNAFGDLGDKFDQARTEAGKTYGTFSRGAYNEALDNINFANAAWGRLMAMANLNELQNIKAYDMSSINNLRYAKDIQGYLLPIYVGKQGMKIFNNITNHNIGMRLLSGAALIDSKQMIFSAQGGTKFGKRRFTKEEIEANKLKVYLLEREAAERRSKTNAKGAEKFNKTANTVMGAMTLLANETPFTGKEYLQAAEDLRQEKVEKFHEAEKVGEAAMMADLAVSATPLLLRGFRWAFNKAGLLVKVPILKTNYSLSLEDALNSNYNFNITGIRKTEWEDLLRLRPERAKEMWEQAKKIKYLDNSVLDGVKNIYKSDWYKLRLLNSGFTEEEANSLINKFLKNIENSRIKQTYVSGPMGISAKGSTTPTEKGAFIEIRPDLDDFDDVITHEGLHASSLVGEDLGKVKNKILKAHNSFENPNYVEYMNLPDEQRVRFLKLADYVEKNGGDYEKVIGNLWEKSFSSSENLPQDFEDLFNFFNYSDIVDMAKNIKSIAPYIIGGSTATLYNTNK